MLGMCVLLFGGGVVGVCVGSMLSYWLGCCVGFGVGVAALG